MSILLCFREHSLIDSLLLKPFICLKGDQIVHVHYLLVAESIVGQAKEYVLSDSRHEEPGLLAGVGDARAAQRHRALRRGQLAQQQLQQRRLRATHTTQCSLIKSKLCRLNTTSSKDIAHIKHGNIPLTKRD